MRRDELNESFEKFYTVVHSDDGLEFDGTHELWSELGQQFDNYVTASFVCKELRSFGHPCFVKRSYWQKVRGCA